MTDDGRAAPSDDIAALPEQALAQEDGGWEAGQAAHAAWMKVVVERGYPDHAWEPDYLSVECARCGKPPQLHATDMVPWDELPQGRRDMYAVTAEAGAAVERGRFYTAIMALVEVWEMVTDATPEAWTEDVDWRVTALHKLALAQDPQP